MKTKKKAAAKHRDTVATLRRDLASVERARDTDQRNNEILGRQLNAAQAEREKFRTAATVLCGAHIGVPQDRCPVCQVAALKVELNNRTGCDSAEARDLRAKLEAMHRVAQQFEARVDEVEKREGEMVATIHLKERDLADFKRGTGFPNDADIVHLCRAGETLKDALRRMAGERDQARQACEIWSGRLAEAERALKVEREGHAITAKARVEAEAAPKAVRVRLNSGGTAAYPVIGSREGSIVGVDRLGVQVLFDGLSVARSFMAQELELVHRPEPSSASPIQPPLQPGEEVRVVEHSKHSQAGRFGVVQASLLNNDAITSVMFKEQVLLVDNCDLRRTHPPRDAKPEDSPLKVNDPVEIIWSSKTGVVAQISGPYPHRIVVNQDDGGVAVCTATNLRRKPRATAEAPTATPLKIGDRVCHRSTGRTGYVSSIYPFAHHTSHCVKLDGDGRILWCPESELRALPPEPRLTSAQLMDVYAKTMAEMIGDPIVKGMKGILGERNPEASIPLRRRSFVFDPRSFTVRDRDHVEVTISFEPFFGRSDRW